MTIRKKLIQILAERYSPNVPLEKYYGEEADQILSLVLEAISLEKTKDIDCTCMHHYCRCEHEGWDDACDKLEEIKKELLN